MRHDVFADLKWWSFISTNVPSITSQVSTTSTCSYKALYDRNLLESYWQENCPYYDSRVVIYARKMFIKLATWMPLQNYWSICFVEIRTVNTQQFKYFFQVITFDLIRVDSPLVLVINGKKAHAEMQAGVELSTFTKSDWVADRATPLLVTLKHIPRQYFFYPFSSTFILKSSSQSLFSLCHLLFEQTFNH